MNLTWQVNQINGKYLHLQKVCLFTLYIIRNFLDEKKFEKVAENIKNSNLCNVLQSKSNLEYLGNKIFSDK